MISRTWAVLTTDAVQAWWASLDDKGQRVLVRGQALLAVHGVHLGYPYTSKIRTSRHPHMRELRLLDRARPLRVLFAFDPLRRAVLLVGGDKTGDAQFYRRLIPVADRLYDEHVRDLKREGLI